MVSLTTLVRSLDGARLAGAQHDAGVSGLSYDSRRVSPGDLFFALGGLHTDGDRFVGDALRRGAVAVVSRREPPPARPVPTIVVDDPRVTMSALSDVFYRHPSKALTCIGVTGTDGKSTTVSLIYQLLRMAEVDCGYLSTVEAVVADRPLEMRVRQSTPEAPELHRLLREIADAGATHAVVEATSHGLSAKTARLRDVGFDAAVLTNVTHEHLEFHGSFEQYRSDKAELFRRAGQWAVINADDPSAEYFREASAATRTLLYSRLHPDQADLGAEVIEEDDDRTTVRFRTPDASVEAVVPLPGLHNVENVLAALLVVSAVLGVDPLDFAPRVRLLHGIRGRLQYVPTGLPFRLLVDYAHTPESFARILPFVRRRTKGRLICLFGSGGERDTAKRPLQGAEAERFSDIVILSDEDPRGEDSGTILRDIAAGISSLREGESLFLIPNRREAIRFAVNLAHPGDTVLFLGKGHEHSIDYADGDVPWDEIDEVAEAATIRERAEKGQDT